MRHGIDRDMGARHAKWFVHSAKTTGWLRETELVPKTQGIVKSIREDRSSRSRSRGVGRCRRRSRRTSRRTSRRHARLYDIVRVQGRDGAAGIVQGEKALGRIEKHEDVAAAERGPYGPGSFPKPYLPETPAQEGSPTR